MLSEVNKVNKDNPIFVSFFWDFVTTLLRLFWPPRLLISQNPWSSPVYFDPLPFIMKLKVPSFKFQTNNILTNYDACEWGREDDGGMALPSVLLAPKQRGLDRVGRSIWLSWRVGRFGQSKNYFRSLEKSRSIPLFINYRGQFNFCLSIECCRIFFQSLTPLTPPRKKFTVKWLTP